MSTMSSVASSQRELHSDEECETAFWNPAPPENDETWTRYLHGAPARETTSKRGAAVDAAQDGDCGVWHSPPRHGCASLGSGSTTATINPYGHLINFSRFLAGGKSGMFSADHALLNEPWAVVSRLEGIEQTCAVTDLVTTGYGLEFTYLRGHFADVQPRTTWRRWRWPRYEYRSDEFALTVQWVVRGDDVLVQQCVVENVGAEPAEVPFQFRKRMYIRDLDYLDGGYQFNETTDPADYLHRSGPNGYGWICVHPFRPASAEEAAPAAAAPPPPATTAADKEGNEEETCAHAEDLYAVAAVASLFLDGVPLKLNGSVDDGLSLECKGPASWTKTLSARGSEGGSRMEVTVAYRMLGLPTPQADWRNFVISNDCVEVDEFVASSAPPCPPGFSISGLQPRIGNERGRRDESSAAGDSGRAGLRILAGDQPRGPPPAGGTRDDDEQARSLADPFRPPVDVPQATSPRDHIEFVARRHLEHILSVCAVPISIPCRHEDRDDSGRDAGEPKRSKAVGIALTCGDTSGHRICHSASFFAFQFLIDVATRLAQADSADPFVASLQRRIHDVCRGHLVWLCHCEKNKDGCFAANYRLWGAVMAEESASWKARDALTDTPFQILKATLFHRLYHRDPLDVELARNLVGRVGRKWLQTLEKLDPRWKYAWPHAREDDVNTFRLDDHVWIWRALKALEDSGLRKVIQSLERPTHDATMPPGYCPLQGRDPQPVFPCTSPRLAIERLQDAGVLVERRGETDSIIILPRCVDCSVGELARQILQDTLGRYSAGDVQRESLQRFTTENNVSRKAMLAVTRSPRESRFLFHARDTALLYGADLGYFPQSSSFHEVWENTITCQRYHEENRESAWDTTLDYALAVLLGCRGRRLNTESPTQLVCGAVEVLFRSTSPSAFFPGLLDLTTKEPETVEDERDRDFYFHVSFEIPYALLANVEGILESYRRLEAGAGGDDEGREGDLDHHQLHQAASEVLQRITSEPKQQQQQQQQQKATGVGRSTGIVDSTRGHHQDAATREWTMKKVMPFNSLIDSSNVVELGEEWLFNYPDFLSRDEDLTWDDIRNDRAGLQDVLTRPIDDGMLEDLRALVGLDRAYVVDTPKQKRLRKLERKHLGGGRWHNNCFLWELLRSPRTARRAKKRLIGLPYPNEVTALVCYAASPSDAEKQALALFFDRHVRYKNYFADEAAHTLNVWRTELHLSFFRLHDGPSLKNPAWGLPRLQVDDFPGSRPPGQSFITRATAGFRFDGDFFDRHWTCHLVEYAPGEPRDDDWMDRLGLAAHLKPKEWRQRKVLELFLLNRMLDTILESTRDIVDRVEKALGAREGSFSYSIQTTDDYASWSRLWGELEPLLQAVEDNLTSVLDTLAQWNGRVPARGLERPRWTRDDERKYRAALTRLQGAGARSVGELHSLAKRTAKLHAFFSARLDGAREQLSFQSNQSIMSFTYVTVIFLPLGFAASIFSMSETPGPALIAHMAVSALVALAITVVVLVNARMLLRLLSPLASVTDITVLPRLVAVDTPRLARRVAVVDAPRLGRSLFVDLARHVVLACLALRDRGLTWTNACRALVGFVVFPVFALAWISQVAYYNLKDLLDLFKDLVRRGSARLPRRRKTSQGQSDGSEGGKAGADRPEDAAVEQGRIPGADSSQTDEDIQQRIERLTRPPKKSRILKTARDAREVIGASQDADGSGSQYPARPSPG
ncbi:hypothetical protein VTK73DRAFT_10214 [Phialemonium thermophilum]|uniref:Uncharacterized protein n=1 Tax=Phialemonium thermophilum TaxID=223376 RepID=A0ABR3VXZ8_9PEZI